MRNNEFIRINHKINLAKMLRFFNIFLAIGLTIIGTTSILFLLIYLKEVSKFYYYLSFLIIFSLPNFYSFLCNLFLDKIDIKVDNILDEAIELEEEKKEELINKYGLENIKKRFEGLSNSDKLKLLSSIKLEMIPSTTSSLINKMDCYDLFSLMNNEFCDIQSKEQAMSFDSGFSRKRCKN